MEWKNGKGLDYKTPPTFTAVPICYFAPQPPKNLNPQKLKWRGKNPYWQHQFKTSRGQSLENILFCSCQWKSEEINVRNMYYYKNWPNHWYLDSRTLFVFHSSQKHSKNIQICLTFNYHLTENLSPTSLEEFVYLFCSAKKRKT